MSKRFKFGEMYRMTDSVKARSKTIERMKPTVSKEVKAKVSQPVMCSR